MTYGREPSNVNREASFVKRISFRNIGASRFTLHEQRDPSLAGC